MTIRTTIYATFNDPKLAKKAAEALLYRGIASSDLSVIQSHLWDGLSEETMAGQRNGSAREVRVGAVGALEVLFVPGFGLVLGSGALASAIEAVAVTIGAGAAAAAMTGYLKNQGVERLYVSHYENAIQSGGAILGATLPSGAVDEGTAWVVLDKFAGMNVSSYISRTYVS